MTTVELLRAAKEQLLTRGWIQGASQTAHGVCLQGAVLATTEGYSLEAITAFVTLADCLPEAPGYNTITHWNDTPGRTPDEVLDLFDRAMARAEQAEAAAVPARGRVKFWFLLLVGGLAVSALTYFLLTEEAPDQWLEEPTRLDILRQMIASNTEK